MEWISIKDQLPEIYDYVLVLSNNQGTGEPKPISIARLDLQNTWGFCDSSSLGVNYGAWSDINYPMGEITHWMPLPHLPDKPCNFCGTPSYEYPKRKCARTPICTNYKS